MFDPILAQLRQGLTPHEVALTLALGTVCGIFPFLGFTTGLCFVTALALRLNQPIIQIVNQILWPVQLAMIVVYIKTGSRLYGAVPLPFNPAEVTKLLADSPHPWTEFWQRFGAMGLYAFTAWLLSVPLIVAVIYFSARPILGRIASNRPGRP